MFSEWLSGKNLNAPITHPQPRESQGLGILLRHSDLLPQTFSEHLLGAEPVWMVLGMSREPVCLN